MYIPDKYFFGPPWYQITDQPINPGSQAWVDYENMPLLKGDVVFISYLFSTQGVSFPRDRVIQEIEADGRAKVLNVYVDLDPTTIGLGHWAEYTFEIEVVDPGIPVGGQTQDSTVWDALGVLSVAVLGAMIYHYTLALINPTTRKSAVAQLTPDQEFEVRNSPDLSDDTKDVILNPPVVDDVTPWEAAQDVSWAVIVLVIFLMLRMFFK